MLVVLDSNILLSALISQAGSPHAIYQAWQKKRFQVVTAIVQIDELRRASRYPKLRNILQPHRVGRLLNNLRGAVIVDPLRVTHDALDPNDAWLLALAEIGGADYLVTGDKHSGLLERGRIGTARILTAAAFCAALD